MSRKFVFIGAGSHNFSRSLARDLLTYPAFEDCTLALVDIDPQGLENARIAIQRIIDEGHYHARIVTSTDRTEVLPGADGVVSMLMAQPLSVFRRDLEICEKYGVSINVGDTRNAAGIFRFLRTVPVMLDILADIRQYCPGAIFLNYTNPMAMLCRAMQEAAPEIVTTGLCHSVQGTAMKFEQLLHLPEGSLHYTCAGINHMAYYLRLEHDGQDMYPALRHAILDDPEVFGQDIVRNEVFRAFGYYVTESSGHFSEYSPWFRKNREKIEQYCMSGLGNTGRPNYTIEVREERARNYEAHIRQFLTEPVDLARGDGLVGLLPREGISLPLPKELAPGQEDLRITLYEETLTAPIEAGTPLGRVSLYLDGNELASAELIAANSVPLDLWLAVARSVKAIINENRSTP